MDPMIQVLSEQFGRFKDAITSRIEQVKELSEHQFAITNLTTDQLLKSDTQNSAAIKELATRQQELKNDIVRLQATLSILAALEAVLSILAATIAGYIAVKTK